MILSMLRPLMLPFGLMLSAQGLRELTRTARERQRQLAALDAAIEARRTELAELAAPSGTESPSPERPDPRRGRGPGPAPAVPLLVGLAAAAAVGSVVYVVSGLWRVHGISAPGAPVPARPADDEDPAAVLLTSLGCRWCRAEPPAECSTDEDRWLWQALHHNECGLRPAEAGLPAGKQP